MDFDKEVDYRLSKWIITNMQENGLLTDTETKKIWQGLIDAFDPPMKSVETITGKMKEEFNGRCTQN